MQYTGKRVRPDRYSVGILSSAALQSNRLSSGGVMIVVHHRPDQIGGNCPMLRLLRCTTLTSRCTAPCALFACCAMLATAVCA